MSDPRTAREALILEALGELDQALTEAAAAREASAAVAQRIEAAAASLDAAAGRYAAELVRLTDETKRAVTEHVERRINAATTDALASHRKAMQEAATLAFSEQLAPAVRDVARQVEAMRLATPAPFAWEKVATALLVGLCIGAAVGWLIRG